MEVHEAGSLMTDETDLRRLYSSGARSLDMARLS